MARLNNMVRKGQRGNATMELSVVLPFVLLGVLGITDFARLGFQSIALANAARAGAAYASHSPQHMNDTTGIQTAVLNELSDTVAPADVNLEIQKYCSCPDGSTVSCDSGVCGMDAATRRTYIRVRVAKSYEPFFEYPGLPKHLTLTREAQIRSR